MKLPIRELSAAAFAPYGQVIEMPERSQDAAGPGWRWWGETVLLEGDERPTSSQLRPIARTASRRGRPGHHRR